MDTREKALEFLKSRSAGLLATVSADGRPRARTVYYACDDSFSIYFLTLDGTRKVDDLRANPHGAFVVTDEALPATLQLEGEMFDLSEQATMDEKVAALAATLFAHGDHFAPLTRFDADHVRLFKLSPTWVRFGDFAQGHGTDEVFAQIIP